MKSEDSKEQLEIKKLKYEIKSIKTRWVNIALNFILVALGIISAGFIAKIVDLDKKILELDKAELKKEIVQFQATKDSISNAIDSISFVLDTLNKSKVTIERQLSVTQKKLDDKIAFNIELIDYQNDLIDSILSYESDKKYLKNLLINQEKLIADLRENVPEKTRKGLDITSDQITEIEYDHGEVVGLKYTPVPKTPMIYPNPTKDYIYLDFKNLNSSSNNEYTLKILNQNGKIVLHDTISNGNNPKIDVRHLKPGVYTVDLTNIQKNEKFILKSIKR